jgi:hypothetical protein
VTTPARGKKDFGNLDREKESPAPKKSEAFVFEPMVLG